MAPRASIRRSAGRSSQWRRLARSIADRAESRRGRVRPRRETIRGSGASAASSREHWASELLRAPSDPGQDPRHLGTVEPLWTLFDLTPGGRPAADEQLEYG